MKRYFRNLERILGQEIRLVNTNQGPKRYARVQKPTTSHSPAVKMSNWVESFPPLPVPELSQSCEKYLKSVKPFLSNDDYQHTEFIVDSFRTGVGKVLQEKLKKRAKTRANWLIDWWNGIYAAYRGPLPFLSNTHGCCSDALSSLGRTGTQLSCAAFFTHHFIQKYLLIQAKKWHQTRLRNEIPLDMKLYYGVFATARMPGLEKDTILNYSLKDGKPSLEMRHIVVIKRHRFYTFDVLTPNIEVLTPAEIERQLYRITAMAESKCKGPGVGALTSIDRRSWKEVQDYLFLLDENNKKIVDVLNKSLFVLVLDENEPASFNAAAYDSGTGDCKNRWFDKGQQVIIYKNRYICNNNDHTHVDGFILLEVFEKTLKHFDDKSYDWKVSSKTRFLPEPIELEFTTDNRILSEIDTAEGKHNAAKEKYMAIDEPFTKFGKKFAKDHSIHPDAMVQMAIQLAYYYLHKRFAATYETATTRKFQGGRTETVRSCSLESQKFVLAMCDTNASSTTKLRLFREACENQVKMMDECCDGQGFDRHFLGLKLLSQEEGMELPELYKDKAWKISGGDGNFILSTSLTGYGHCHGAMGPMVEDGYGVFYTIEKDRLNIVVSSFVTPATDASEMKKQLDKALCDIRDLLLLSKL